MLLTENTSKAGAKQEQCQDTQLPSGTVLSQGTLPVKTNAWKSTEVSHLQPFPVAALTNYRQPSALNQHKWVILQFCRLEV